MKNQICLPDYRGGSIVNLMSSIGGVFGWKSPYAELKGFGSKEIGRYKNVVLIILDGLGYEYLKEKGDESFLFRNLRSSMTSVFLPTTACAVTSFLTGVAPQQHAYTGWHMNFKEVGVVSRAFTLSPRAGESSFISKDLKIDNFFNESSFFSKIKGGSFSVSPLGIKGAEFNKYINNKSKDFYFNSLEGFFRQIKKAINKKGRKYIYSYWNEFDHLAHEFGVESKKVEKHFKELDVKFEKFSKSLDKDTLLIITADHGFIDTPINKIIWMEDYPKIKECLSAPLSGEGRVVYCSVKVSKSKEFEKYVKSEFSKYCWIYKSEELIKKNYFGLFKPHFKLFDRVGDYTLICKDNYYIGDVVKKSDKENLSIGHHAGVSSKEMIVPLVLVKKDD